MAGRHVLALVLAAGLGFASLPATGDEAGLAKRPWHPVGLHLEAAKAWVAQYRAGLSPLLDLFRKFDNQGLGEEDCPPVASAYHAAKALPLGQVDPVTRDTVTALLKGLAEAKFQCERWDPSPFSMAMGQVEFLMKGMEETLAYEIGLRAFPGLNFSKDDHGYSVRAVVGPGNTVRAKRFRSR